MRRDPVCQIISNQRGLAGKCQSFLCLFTRIKITQYQCKNYQCFSDFSRRKLGSGRLILKGTKLMICLVDTN